VSKHHASVLAQVKMQGGWFVRVLSSRIVVDRRDASCAFHRGQGGTHTANASESGCMGVNATSGYLRLQL
jgi:hypothetical protein